MPACAGGNAEVPFVERDLAAADRERPRNGDFVDWLFRTGCRSNPCRNRQPARRPIRRNPDNRAALSPGSGEPVACCAVAGTGPCKARASRKVPATCPRSAILRCHNCRALNKFIVRTAITVQHAGFSYPKVLRRRAFADSALLSDDQTILCLLLISAILWLLRLFPRWKPC